MQCFKDIDEKVRQLAEKIIEQDSVTREMFEPLCEDNKWTAGLEDERGMSCSPLPSVGLDPVEV